MALTADEVTQLRFHLGFGNVGVGAYPYTPDGFQQLFEDVIGPNLASGTETTTASAVTAAGVATITLASATGFAASQRVVVDVGDDVEIVVVRALSGANLSAKFALTHAANFPVVTLSPVARLRMLIHAADKSWASQNESGIAQRAGIKRADDVEFFPGSELLGIRGAQYDQIVDSIASLVRVRPLRSSGSGARVEVY